MNKEKIVEELNKWLDEEFDTQYKCVSVSGDLSLAFCINGNIYTYVAWFKGFRRDRFYFDDGGSDFKINIQLIKDNVIRKFYDKTIELMSEYEPKYTVQVIKGNESAYLNYSSVTKRFGFLNSETFGSVKTEFTKSEIEEFKKRDDLAVDWDKAVIKEVNG